MATISRLKPGQVVYSIESRKMGNTTASIKVPYEVEIIEVNEAEGFVMASWNNNKARKYYQESIARWRVKKPEPKKTVFGRTSY